MTGVRDVYVVCENEGVTVAAVSSRRGNDGEDGDDRRRRPARRGGGVHGLLRVLSGKRAISATTRQRVLDSVRVLGYHPNAGARALASKRANVIALVLPLRAGMNLPVLMQFATSVVATARQYDHDVLLMTADEGPDGIRRVAASAMVDGLLLMDVEVHDARVPLLRDLAEPSVLIGFPADAEGLTCVDLDFNRAGARCARSTWPSAATARSRCWARPRSSTNAARVSPNGRGQGSRRRRPDVTFPRERCRARRPTTRSPRR